MSPAADPLAELRPLHLPADIGWWPPAPGWWLAALLVLALATFAVLLWRRGRARREALRIIRFVARADLPDPQLAQQVGLLLKRYATVCYPQHNAAALTGLPWLEFLHRHGGGRDYMSAAGRALIDAAFAQHAHVHRDELLALARHWVKHNAKGARCRHADQAAKDAVR